MRNVIGASSLKRALQNLDFANRNTLGNYITAIPSLSLNPYAQNDSWNAILVFVLTDKMDTESRKLWQLDNPGTGVL